jgi:hypothetical protein
VSRTFRNTKHANVNSRHMKTPRGYRMEARAADALREAGFAPRPRVAGAKGRIPNPYDDYSVAAYGEQYHFPWRSYDQRVSREMGRGLTWRAAWDYLDALRDADAASLRAREDARRAYDRARRRESRGRARG